tara:strand:+ start:2606 stop:3652 length:1047 start_codon:yes stop_codon:yes gene_type:complete
MHPVKVLIVDDSPTMRAVLKAQLEAHPMISVIGAAANPLAARQAIKTLAPDVITLDLNMPGMHGLDFLKRLMSLHAMPVVVVSSDVRGQSDEAVHARALGAYGCFLKPRDGSREGAFDALRKTVLEAARMGASAPAGGRSDGPVRSGADNFKPNDRIVAIGASTGGVDALLTILSGFPGNCPPTVITQHMPRSFTASFAQRLNHNSAPTVVEATNGAPLKVGHVYLAPGGDAHLEIIGRGTPICRLREGPAISGHRPSVDALFGSVALLGIPAVGVLLTGMGGDGARGLLEMRKAGAATLGQDKNTSLVYGMPRVAHERGAVEKQVPLNRIAREILKRCTATCDARFA